MNIDLQRYGFDQLTLHIWPEVETTHVRDLLTRIGRDVMPGPSDALHAYIPGTFRKSGIAYHVLTSIISHDDPPLITIRYLPVSIHHSTIRSFRKGFSDLKELVGMLGVSCTVTGSAEYELEKGWKTVVSLPMFVFNSSNNVFDEIRGLRLVHVENNKEVESTIIDIHNDGTLSSSLEVTYQTMLSQNIAGQTLTLLSKLRSKMIVQTEDDEAES